MSGGSILKSNHAILLPELTIGLYFESHRNLSVSEKLKVQGKLVKLVMQKLHLVAKTRTSCWMPPEQPVAK